MPLTSKGEEIMESMKKQYGSEKGEQVFYASANKGTITGVHDDDVSPAELRKAAEKLDEAAAKMRRDGEREHAEEAERQARLYRRKAAGDASKQEEEEARWPQPDFVPMAKDACDSQRSEIQAKLEKLEKEAENGEVEEEEYEYYKKKYEADLLKARDCSDRGEGTEAKPSTARRNEIVVHDYAVPGDPRKESEKPRNEEVAARNKAALEKAATGMNKPAKDGPLEDILGAVTSGFDFGESAGSFDAVTDEGLNPTQHSEKADEAERAAKQLQKRARDEASDYEQAGPKNVTLSDIQQRNRLYWEQQGGTSFTNDEE